MALGNNMSMGQARGKAKPIMVKRIREVKAADRYLSFTGSALHAIRGRACGSRDVNITYYHNGRNTIPRAYIQFQDRGRSFTVEINEAGMVVGSILSC